MLVLITGASGSGKSAFAEHYICSAGKKEIIYLAAMEPFGKEARERIARHRQMRAGKGFLTLERYTGLNGLDLQRSGANEAGEERAVLLECMSNLTANEMFGEDGYGTKQGMEALADHILGGVRHILAQCGCLVIVTNEVFSDGIEYDPQTQEYQKLLGTVNCALAKEADEVYEVVCHVPVQLKPPVQ